MKTRFWAVALFLSVLLPLLISCETAVHKGDAGKDGITPQLRINEETNMWEVSYDNEETWSSLGVPATGKTGQAGVAGATGKDGITPHLRINEETNVWEISYDNGKAWVSLGVKGTDCIHTEVQNDATVRNYQISQGESIDALDSLSAWKQTKYPNKADNVSYIKENTQIAKCGTSIEMNVKVASGGVSIYKSVSLNLLDVTRNISLWAYLPQAYENCAIQITLYTSSIYGDTSTRAYATTYTNTMSEGWTMLVLHEDDFVLADGFDWADVKTVSISAITPASVSDFRVLINDLRVGCEWIPKIIFRFDDGLKGVYENAFPALEARGMSGIVYCNTLFNERADNGEIDPVTKKPYSEGYCTTEELLLMYNRGFDVANHSRSHFVFVDEKAHYGYADTDDAEAKRTSILYQIRSSQDWLIDKGFFRSAKFFAVPGGHNTPLCQEAIKECGVLTSTTSVHASSRVKMLNLN